MPVPAGREEEALVMFIHLVLLLLLTISSRVVYALTTNNITIDDSHPAILYLGNWATSANTTLDIGGSHKLTQDGAATAIFNFTGVAIYFASPLWPYLVNTAVSLDSGPPILLDLVDHTRPDAGSGPETVPSQVIWGTAGLSNTQHTLVISVGLGQPFAIVDALIYTVLDPGDLTTASSVTSSSAIALNSTTSSFTPTSSTANPTSSTGTTSTSTSTSTPTTTTTNNNTPTNPSTHVLPIVLGTVLGLLALLIILAGIWCCNRRRKRPTSEAWTVEGHPYSSAGTGTTPRMISSGSGTLDGGGSGSGGGGDTGYYYYQPNNSWTRYPTSSLPPHPGVKNTKPPVQSSQPWQGTTAQIAQQYASGGNNTRAPNRYYQPTGNTLSTLSTITETSTPPLGGGVGGAGGNGNGSPRAHSPSASSSQQREDVGYFDFASHGGGEGGGGRGGRSSSPPLSSANESRTGGSHDHPVSLKTSAAGAGRSLGSKAKAKAKYSGLPAYTA